MSRFKKKYLSFICCSLLTFVLYTANACAQNQDYFPVRQNGKIGFIDKTGTMVISPRFDSASTEDDVACSEGLAVVKLGSRWGYIDMVGEFVIQPKFEFTPGLFHDGLAQAVIKSTDIEKKGPLDPSQKYIVNEETLGFINKTGEFVGELKFIEERTRFVDGMAKVRKGDKFGYVDKMGRFVIEPSFANAEDFSEGLAAVRLEGHLVGLADERSEYKTKYGFIDKSGKFVIKPQFDSAESFSEGLAAVGMNSKNGYIDKTGKLVIAARYDSAFQFSDGLAKVAIGDKSGFIDTRGNMVISPRFAYSGFGNSLNYRGFKEGLAAVEVNNKTGYIDKTGKIVIAATYKYGTDFNSGLAEVFIGSEPGMQKSYLINKTGKVIWEHKTN
ncbi:MAG TPA: WG repeat-containing protein [Pyrinomonadaceae bacterium]|nr:WG repeat-containing protein [Chloracidobacterium sp.]HQX56504.1 WG repeat-containing protein [Pyrinomonadaceae bacterium]MBK7804112.1 WG repeat-containing protein [Chloracidobacterium sp.]MBK9437826.1 WG repeat-containing protein [Chloracidobacterium sp.]MBL0242334.1 WG repeat-containing protein [Chloracidobacterium sp.]